MAKVRVIYPFKFKKTAFQYKKYRKDGSIEHARDVNFAYRVTRTGIDHLNIVVWRDSKWDTWNTSNVDTGATITNTRYTNRNEAVSFVRDVYGEYTEEQCKAALEAFLVNPKNVTLSLYIDGR